MRNLEIKCPCPDLEGILHAAVGLGARDAGTLMQEDRFFNAPHARLKLRDFGDGSGELIGYRRPDLADTRGSDYLICAVPHPGELAAVLRLALGEVGVVRKRRRLLLLDHTRIHLDEVEGLGSFVELETVLRDQSEEEARAELERIAAALGLAPRERLAPAYLDLLRGLTRE